jgi:hypothetical protein
MDGFGVFYQAFIEFCSSQRDLLLHVLLCLGIESDLFRILGWSRYANPRHVFACRIARLAPSTDVTNLATVMESQTSSGLRLRTILD